MLLWKDQLLTGISGKILILSLLKMYHRFLITLNTKCKSLTWSQTWHAFPVSFSLTTLQAILAFQHMKGAFLAWGLVSNHPWLASPLLGVCFKKSHFNCIDYPCFPTLSCFSQHFLLLTVHSVSEETMSVFFNNIYPAPAIQPVS